MITIGNKHNSHPTLCDQFSLTYKTEFLIVWTSMVWSEGF